MTAPYMHVRCEKCSVCEWVYAGGLEIDAFDSDDWEGKTIVVSRCKSCKAAAA